MLSSAAVRRPRICASRASRRCHQHAGAGLDFALFLALNSAIGHPTLSGVVGYAGGIVLHYQLSHIFVFATAARRYRRTAGSSSSWRAALSALR
jgi:putative flippase GtrA